MEEHTDQRYEALEETVKELFSRHMKEKDTLTDQEALNIIEETVFSDPSSGGLQESAELIRRLYQRMRCRTGILDPYIRDERINEIMVNGPGHIFVEMRSGITAAPEQFDSREELEDIIRNIAADVHREINEMNPILDARLPDGSRVNAVYHNVAADGPVLTIRKFSPERITIRQMITKGTLTRACADTLALLVRCGYNIFISGGTSSGKTTFLNALTDMIPENDRVIVIEDSRELMLPHIRDLGQMECHTANTLGQGQVTMDMLIRTSLRMRPDRIIVGEVRGKEVADMLQALNTGHDGSMSTGHGNSVRGMLRRLEAMYLMAARIPMDSIRGQIVEGIDVMVHLIRTADGKRQVSEVQELVSVSGSEYVLNPLFRLNGEMKLEQTGNRIQRREKLRRAGDEDGDRL